VSKADTTTGVSTSKTPTVFGETVTFTATVSVVAPGVGTPTGNVQFYADGAPLGSGQTLSGGKATVSTSSLSVATHPITATYTGTTNFNGSTASQISQVVSKADTTTAVTTAPNPSSVGQSVTLTATVSVVSPGVGTPTGNVQFYADGATLGSPQGLSGNAATYSTSSLLAGTRHISATYLSNLNFNSSTSSTVDQIVGLANTTTTITSDLPDPSVAGQS
jgi:hypothetical protein